MFCNDCGDAMELITYKLNPITKMVEAVMECEDCDLIDSFYYTQEEWDDIINNFDE